MIDTTDGAAKQKTMLLNLLNLRNNQQATGSASHQGEYCGESLIEKLPSEMIANILSHLDGNRILTIFRCLNRAIYSEVVPWHLQTAVSLHLNIPKVEEIKKERKSIDDLLTWNREVKYFLGQSHSLLELDFNCHDFKVFNPLNEKLISSTSFSQLRKYSVGVFDEDKFPKSIKEDSVLCTPTLNSVCLRFVKINIDVADCLT